MPRGLAIPALAAVVLVAFAGNSVMGRMALAEGLADPVVFAAIRVLSGAATLCVLLLGRGGRPCAVRPGAAAALALYMLGFSLAFQALEAGTGALILFGGVQATAFAAALAAREPLPARRWVGAGLALVGTALLLRPVGAGGEGLWALSMAAAGIGWGLYTRRGRHAYRPLEFTAGNFLCAAPLVLAALAVAVLARGLGPTEPEGLALAAFSGAVTSALGYTVWDALLPGLPLMAAGLARIVVPVLAVLAGFAVLGEAPGPWGLAAGALVLAGAGVGLVPRRAP